VIEAAHAVFADAGPGAPMDEVARAAGVGVATVYRHFPAKDLLIEAVMEQRLTAATRELETARSEEPDAWSAFVRFFRVAARMAAEDRALSLCLGGSLRLGHEARRIQLSLVEATMQLMREAQRSGRLRPDLQPGDLAFLLGLGRSAWARPERAENLLGRHLAIIVDGLEAGRGRHPGASRSLVS
jgi:AcrR family transcriptional regulator